MNRLHKDAHANDPEAMYELGNEYFSVKGVPGNISGIRWNRAPARPIATTKQAEREITQNNAGALVKQHHHYQSPSRRSCSRVNARVD